MLEPDDRNLLLNSLRPPLGYRLDHAVGTTFTLDLLALLIAPTAFTLFDLEDDEGKPNADPVALLRAVREYGERITVFCQGGQIAVPPHDQLLYANLEDSVFQVVGKRGLFHPKVWVLRFEADDAHVRYRVLCLSRNLTFDRSWDTVLQLDGELIERRNAFAANHPLGDFIGALPGLALRPGRLPKGREETLATIANEIRRVSFDLPEGFDEIRFWPLGIKGHNAWPFTGDIRRMLVVSPFIGSAMLNRLGRLGEGHVLVSRIESLDDLDDRATLGAFDVRVMDDATELDADPEDEGAVPAQNQGGADESLQGLHAKVYAADRGHRASIWVGSANATGAGISQNAELLIELAGTRWLCGVDAVLNGKTEGGDAFGSLLRPYDVDAEPVKRDPASVLLEANVESFQLALAREKMILSIEVLGRDEEAEEVAYEAELLGPGPGRPAVPSGMTVFAWPITRNPGTSRVSLASSEDQVLARFSGLTSATITPFVAFEIEASEAGAKHLSRFVLRLPLRGAPKGRREDILRALLSDKERILRYLLLILAETDGSGALAPDVIEALSSPGTSDGKLADRLDLPLLEGLLRALMDDAEKLEQVARLLTDLDLASTSDEILPDGFREIWEPIWNAQSRARS